jgi:hypothetical protein
MFAVFTLDGIVAPVSHDWIVVALTPTSKPASARVSPRCLRHTRIGFVFFHSKNLPKPGSLVIVTMIFLLAENTTQLSVLIPHVFLVDQIRVDDC